MRGLSLFVGYSAVLALALGGIACTTGIQPIQPAQTPTTTQTSSFTPSPTGAPRPTSPPTAAQVSFSGKTITVVVPYNAGGGSDIIARLYARYLGRFLPGNPTVVVRNIPGGDSTIGANYAYSSKPDGLTLLVTGSSLILADILRKPALKFSLNEMTVSIVAPASSTLYFVRRGLVDRPEEIVRAKGIVFGGTTSTDMVIFVCVKEFVGIPTDKVVSAYAGGGDILRAFLAGEINSMSSSNIEFAGATRPYYESGQIAIIFQSGILDQAGNIVRHPTLPADTLTAKELYEKINGKTPLGPAYESYKSIVSSVQSMSRMLLLPPGAPDTVKTAYWAAGEGMAKTPEFRKSAETLVGSGVDWMAGQAVDNVLKKEFGLKPEIREWLRDTMSTKYGMVLQ